MAFQRRIVLAAVLELRSWPRTHRDAAHESPHISPYLPISRHLEMQHMRLALHCLSAAPWLLLAGSDRSWSLAAGALEDLDAILSVDGLSGIFIGPNDLVRGGRRLPS